MSEIIGILSAFGISAPAGLNAYLPLLVVGLAAKFTNFVKLNQPYDLLANEWVLAVLTLLVLVETFVDKIPAVDSINDVISTVLRPLAGAILFASSNNVVSDLHPVLAVICGLLAAGSVHAIKATTRPVVTTLTGGVGNPVVSFVEDSFAIGMVLVAIFAPILVGLFLVGLLVGAFFLMRRVTLRRQLV